jgi:hypothetical protein
MTSSFSSSSPGGLVATDNDDDDETTLKRLATAFLEDYLHARFSGCGTLHRWAGGVEELLILEVKSLQRKIFKECCFAL